jgi:hypothetical protein
LWPWRHAGHCLLAGVAAALLCCHHTVVQSLEAARFCRFKTRACAFTGVGVAVCVCVEGGGRRVG